MNILASIKSGKRMSLSHWRYKLLHWCFGEKAKSPSESGLPQFLYSHYCPLFHLTNLIAILLPLIVLTKIFVGIIRGIVCVTSMVSWDTIPYVNWLPQKNSKPELTDEEKEVIEFNTQRENILSFMTRYSYGLSEFEQFWDLHYYHFFGLEKDEAKQFYLTNIKMVVEARERKKESKKLLQERMIFWANFSHIFVRWFFNIAYVGLAVFVGWLFIMVIPVLFFGLIDFVHFLLTFEVLPFLIFVGTWLVRIVVVGGAFATLIYGFYRFPILQRCGKVVVSSVALASPPLTLLGQCLTVPFKWIANSFANVCEFVEMFYKENCPIITIVSREDEEIEQKVDEV